MEVIESDVTSNRKKTKSRQFPRLNINIKLDCTAVFKQWCLRCDLTVINIHGMMK